MTKFQHESSADLIRSWEDDAEDDHEASIAEIKLRAKEAGVNFLQYVEDVQAGHDPATDVQKVAWAFKPGDYVGPECKAYLKRLDVLHKVDVFPALLKAVLNRLARENPQWVDVDGGDRDVLNKVRDVWRILYDGQVENKKKRDLKERRRS